MSRKIGDKTYLSPNEVAERMGVSLRTVQRWISRGGVISSPWLDMGTARRRTWHQLRESPEKPKRLFSSDVRVQYRPTGVSAPSMAERTRDSFVRRSEGPDEIRLSFITDPSSGFHYFPEEEVMNLVKHLTDEGSDFWRVRRAVEAVEWRQKQDALRERAATEPAKDKPASEKSPDSSESGTTKKNKQTRPD